MTIKCVEPGEAIDGREKYLVEVPVNDELLFPHVDSCLAIAFVLNDGRMIGGHVGMQMPNSPDLNPNQNAEDISEDMLFKKGGRKVTKVILVGPKEYGWAGAVEEILEKVDCEDTLFVDTTEIGGGVDVSLEKGVVFIRLSKGGARMLTRPYAKIENHQTVEL